MKNAAATTRFCDSYHSTKCIGVGNCRRFSDVTARARRQVNKKRRSALRYDLTERLMEWISEAEMKRAIVMFLLVAFGCVVSSGCTYTTSKDSQYIKERPTVNIPLAWRESNYLDTGSCVHATLITLLRWQGRLDDAAKWRRDFSGGEWAHSLKNKLDSRSIRYAYTIDGDVRFLEWACRTRRGCGIAINGGAHMVALVHLDAELVAIIDNNDTSKFIWIPRNKFIAEWKSSGGWAVAPVYTPAAPLPQ